MSLLVFVDSSNLCVRACVYIHVYGNVQQLHFSWSVAETVSVKSKQPPPTLLMTLNHNRSKYREGHTRSLLPPVYPN